MEGVSEISRLVNTNPVEEIISTNTLPNSKVPSHEPESELKIAEQEVTFLMSKMIIEDKLINILDDDDEPVGISSKGTSELKEYLIDKQNLGYLQDMTNEQEQNTDSYPK
jgi:hypothetical protein